MGCDIKVAQGKDLIPGLPDPFGKEAAFTFANAKLAVNLGEYYIKISTDLKVVGLGCGQAEIEGGKITYTNEILGIYSETIWGIRAALKPKIDFNALNAKIRIEGEAELAFSNRWNGITVGGQLTASLDLWIVHPSINVGGKLTAGLEITHSGQFQFVLAGRANGKTQNAFYLSWSGGQGGGY